MMPSYPRLLVACCLVASACTPGTGDVRPPPPGDHANINPLTDTDPPTPTEPTVEVTYLAWQEHRGCWAIREVEQPASVWQSWIDNDCEMSLEMDRVYWMSDEGGHCGSWAQSLTQGSCAVNDMSGWFTNCDPDEHACCAAAQPSESGVSSGVEMCYPNPYYEPAP